MAHDTKSATVMRLDPAASLRSGLSALSRSDIERAWSVADVARKSLGGNIVQRAEVAAYLLAQILAEIGNVTDRPDDLADAAAAVDSLSCYLNGRMAQIVIEMANA
jgi:hypothetical protein